MNGISDSTFFILGLLVVFGIALGGAVMVVFPALGAIFAVFFGMT